MTDNPQVLHKCNKRSDCQHVVKCHIIDLLTLVFLNVQMWSLFSTQLDMDTLYHTLFFLACNFHFICIPCCRFVSKYLLKIISNHYLFIVHCMDNSYKV